MTAPCAKTATIAIVMASVRRGQSARSLVAARIAMATELAPRKVLLPSVTVTEVSLMMV